MVAEAGAEGADVVEERDDGPHFANFGQVEPGAVFEPEAGVGFDECLEARGLLAAVANGGLEVAPESSDVASARGRCDGFAFDFDADGDIADDEQAVSFDRLPDGLRACLRNRGRGGCGFRCRWARST
jgi:hypothetical protein